MSSADAELDVPGDTSADVDARDGAFDPRCFADFPCQGYWRCVTDYAYRPVKTVGCEMVCGGVPCSGMTCWDDGDAETCPSGTRCAPPPSPVRCVPLSEAGADGEADGEVDGAAGAADAADAD